MKSGRVSTQVHVHVHVAVTHFRMEPGVYIPPILRTSEIDIHRLQVTFFTRVPDLHTHPIQKEAIRTDLDAWDFSYSMHVAFQVISIQISVHVG